MTNISATELAQLPQDIHAEINEASAVWADLYKCIEYGTRLLMYGPPGTGKSSAASKHKLNASTPLERLTITMETCWPEVRGSYGLGKDGMVWMDGPGIRAWRQGSRLVIDEIDEAGGDTVPGLHMLLDDSAVARMTLPNGETVTPHENFHCFATTNQDPRALGEALADRFVVKRFVQFPNPTLLFSLPKEIRASAAYALFGNKSGTAYAGMTSRSWVEIGRLMDRRGCDLSTAVDIVAGMKNAKGLKAAITIAHKKVMEQNKK